MTQDHEARLYRALGMLAALHDTPAPRTNLHRAAEAHAELIQQFAESSKEEFADYWTVVAGPLPRHGNADRNSERHPQTSTVT